MIVAMVMILRASLRLYLNELDQSESVCRVLRKIVNSHTTPDLTPFVEVVTLFKEHKEKFSAVDIEWFCVRVGQGCLIS